MLTNIIKLKPNASRKETSIYSQDVLSMIKTYDFSEEQIKEASKAGYEDSKYYTSSINQEQLTGVQGYFLMKILINSLLNTRIEYIDSSILAICLNIRTDAFNRRNIKPLLESKIIPDKDIIYDVSKLKEEFYKLNQRGCNMVIANTKIRNLSPIRVISDYYETLNKLSISDLFNPNRDISNLYRAVKGDEANLEASINELRRVSEYTVDITVKIVNDWVYHLLNFNKDFNPSKLKSDTSRNVIDGSTSQQQLINVFLLGRVMNAITAKITDLIVNNRVNVGETITDYVPEALYRIDNQNPNNPQLAKVLQRVRYEDLTLYENTFSETTEHTKDEKWKDVKFNNVADIRRIIQLNRTSVFLEARIVIRFGDKPEDAVTLLDGIPISEANMHVIPEELYAFNYTTGNAVVYGTDKWYNWMYNRMVLGFATIDDIDINRRKQPRSNKERSLGIWNIKLIDHPDVKLNIFEIWTMLNLPLENSKYNNESIVRYAETNEPVDFKTLYDIICIYLEDQTDFTDELDKLFWIHWVVAKWIITTYPEDNFILKYNRRIIKASKHYNKTDRNDNRFYIKSDKMLTFNEDIDKVTSRQAFQQLENPYKSWHHDIVRPPYQDGNNGFTTVIQYALFRLAVEMLNKNPNMMVGKYINNTFSKLHMVNNYHLTEEDKNERRKPIKRNNPNVDVKESTSKDDGKWDF